MMMTMMKRSKPFEFSFGAVDSLESLALDEEVEFALAEARDVAGGHVDAARGDGRAGVVGDLVDGVAVRGAVARGLREVVDLKLGREVRLLRGARLRLLQRLLARVERRGPRRGLLHRARRVPARRRGQQRPCRARRRRNRCHRRCCSFSRR